MAETLTSLRAADRALGEIAPGGALAFRIRASVRARSRQSPGIAAWIRAFGARRTLVAVACAAVALIWIIARTGAQLPVARSSGDADDLHDLSTPPDPSAHEATPIAPGPSPVHRPRNGDEVPYEPFVPRSDGPRRSVPYESPPSLPIERDEDEPRSYVRPDRGSMDEPSRDEVPRSMPRLKSLRTWPNASLDEVFSIEGPGATRGNGFAPGGPTGEAEAPPSPHHHADAPPNERPDADAPPKQDSGCVTLPLEMGFCVDTEVVKKKNDSAICEPGQYLSRFDIQYEGCEDGLSSGARYSCCPEASEPRNPSHDGGGEGSPCPIVSFAWDGCMNEGELLDLAKCEPGFLPTDKKFDEEGCDSGQASEVFLTCCESKTQLNEG